MTELNSFDFSWFLVKACQAPIQPLLGSTNTTATQEQQLPGAANWDLAVNWDMERLYGTMCSS